MYGLGWWKEEWLLSLSMVASIVEEYKIISKLKEIMNYVIIWYYKITCVVPMFSL